MKNIEVYDIEAKELERLAEEYNTSIADLIYAVLNNLDKDEMAELFENL